MNEPLIVYDKSETAFVSNGLRLLSPISAEYSIEMNQAGSIHVEQPMDEDGDWKSLQPWNIITAPIMYRGEVKRQPFRIYRRVKKRSSDGVPVIAVDALHIFYDLNFVVLEDVRPTNLNGQDALQWIMNRPYNPSGSSRLPIQHFTFSSNIATLSTAYYEWKTVSGALIGEDNCFLNRWGGELYVDGYYFSIRTKMEGSKENAFYITHGVNLSEVEETVDVTDTFSQFVGADDYGDSMNASVPLTYSGLPYEKTLYAFFSYSDDMSEAERAAQFAGDFNDYMGKIQEVSVGYKISVSELPLDDPFRALESYEVGDSGTIRDEELDIVTTQRILKKTVDLLTGNVVSLETGNLAKSIARKTAFSNTITTGESAQQKQTQAIAAQVNQLVTDLIRTTGHAGMALHTHDWLAHFTHGELSGEENV